MGVHVAARTAGRLRRVRRGQLHAAPDVEHRHDDRQCTRSCRGTSIAYHRHPTLSGSSAGAHLAGTVACRRPDAGERAAGECHLRPDPLVRPTSTAPRSDARRFRPLVDRGPRPAGGDRATWLVAARRPTKRSGQGSECPCSRRRGGAMVRCRPPPFDSFRSGWLDQHSESGRRCPTTRRRRRDGPARCAAGRALLRPLRRCASLTVRFRRSHALSAAAADAPR